MAKLFEQREEEQTAGGSLQEAKQKKIPVNLKIVIPGAVAVLAVLLIAAFLIVGGRKKLVLADYIKVEYSGSGSEGTADVEFDKEKFAEDIVKYAKHLDRTPSKSDIKSILVFKNEGISESTLDQLDDIGSEVINSLVQEAAKSQLDISPKISDEEKIGYYFLQESYSYFVESSLTELQNGDKITVTFKANNDLAKKYKLKFDTEDLVLTVDGIKEDA